MNVLKVNVLLAVWFGGHFVGKKQKPKLLSFSGLEGFNKRNISLLQQLFDAYAQNKLLFSI